MRLRAQSRSLIVVLTLVATSPVWARPPQAPPANCVAIGAPKPALTYSYRYTDSGGGASQDTSQWPEFTATTSRLIQIKTGPNGGGTSTFIGQHHMADDVLALESSTASGTDGGGPFKTSMKYQPAAIGDPAVRACAGKTWTIPTVTATNISAQGSFTTKTDPGTMTIVAIHESVTVPAGTFDTVRYTKTMTSPRGRVVDEFWKSIDHGVTVKHTSVMPGVTANEILIGIK